MHGVSFSIPHQPHYVVLEVNFFVDNIFLPHVFCFIQSASLHLNWCIWIIYTYSRQLLCQGLTPLCYLLLFSQFLNHLSLTYFLTGYLNIFLKTPSSFTYSISTCTRRIVFSGCSRYSSPFLGKMHTYILLQSSWINILPLQGKCNTLIPIKTLYSHL